MKAIDTNVLVRLLTRDDPRQARRAADLIDSQGKAGQKVFVSNPVLLELCWVLAAAYGYSRESIISAIERLNMTPVISFERKQMFEELIVTARSTKHDLPDLIVALCAKHNGCISTLTFDKRAARSKLFELI
jgi:predicted nucleic-acid-binding protein